MAKLVVETEEGWVFEKLPDGNWGDEDTYWPTLEELIESVIDAFDEDHVTVRLVK